MEDKQGNADIVSEMTKAYNALLELCETKSSQLKPEDQAAIADVAAKFVAIMSACDQYTTKWGRTFGKVRIFLELINDEKDEGNKQLFVDKINELLQAPGPDGVFPLVQMEEELEKLLKQFAVVTEATANLGMSLKPYKYDITARNYLSIGVGALGVAVGIALMATAWTGVGPLAGTAAIALGASLLKRGAQNLADQANKKKLETELNQAIAETNTIKTTLHTMFKAVENHTQDISILKDLPVFQLPFVKNACDSFEKLQTCVRGFLLQPQPAITPSESTPLLARPSNGNANTTSSCCDKLCCLIL